MWAFASTTECTTEDRQLERAINERLGAGHGSVSCFRDPAGFGLIFSYMGMTKEFRRDRFELDVDRLMTGLALMRNGNQWLPPGWVYDAEDADALEME